MANKKKINRKIPYLDQREKMQELDDIKHKLKTLEPQLQKQSIVSFHTFATPQGDLQVHLTNRLYKKCRKDKIWKSRAMCSTLRNACYGFHVTSRSRGGSDGIFRIDRDFSPPNSMMKKIFKFIDTPGDLSREISDTFAENSEWLAVRLVSHHLRLLGVIVSIQKNIHLILVDYDNQKGN